MSLVEAECRWSRERGDCRKTNDDREQPRVMIQWKSTKYKMMIIELIEGLVLVDELYSPVGDALGEKELVGMLKEVFGVDISNYQQLRDQFFERTRELTPFLKRMITAILKEADSRRAWKKKK
ncbi:RteC domain-containing protein [Butyricimonas hominis]|uniref:RteC domain-containing protein n=1 Tax=Butyricimonas hominis TaxID=2763032 RepID=UPI0035181982